MGVDVTAELENLIKDLRLLRERIKELLPRVEQLEREAYLFAKVCEQNQTLDLPKLSLTLKHLVYILRESED